jgi:hypothetical protein
MYEFIHIVKENVLTWRKPALSRLAWPVFNCASWFVRSLCPIRLAAFELPYRPASEINAVGIMGSSQQVCRNLL